MNSTPHRWLLGAALAAVASASFAHTGHGTESLMAGLTHPLGVDHVFAALAVGLWCAAGWGRGGRWIGPAVFMSGVVAGAFGAAAFAPQAPSDTALAASVALLGALLVAPHALPRRLALAVLAGAAVLHGAAHGVEGALSPAFNAYVAGLLLATGGLLVAGVAVGTTLQRLHRWAWRSAALGISAVGLLLISMA